MNAFPSHAPFLTPPPVRTALSLEELTVCVRGLDPGSRALLDLSLRRRLPFEAMAGVLQTDPFDLARRRARAVARIAADLDLEGAGVVATVKAALASLPDDAWGVPVPAGRAAVQAEPMADAARALMVKLREQRRLAHEEALAKAALREQPTIEMDVVEDVTSLGAMLAEAESVKDVSVREAPARELARLEEKVGDRASVRSAARETADRLVAQLDELAEKWAVQEEAPDESPEEQPTAETEAVRADAEPDEQPTVETEAIRIDAETEVEAWSPPRPPIAASPMAAAYSHHPAFAVEEDDAVAPPPPLAEALAFAAAEERAAAEAFAASAETPEPTSEPAAPVSLPVDERAAGRRFARGGLLIGLLLAIVRFLLGRR